LARNSTTKMLKLAISKRRLRARPRSLYNQT